MTSCRHLRLCTSVGWNNFKLDISPDKVIRDCIPHDHGIFIIFVDIKFVEMVILRHHNRPLCGKMVTVQTLTPKLTSLLVSWKPSILGVYSKPEQMGKTEIAESIPKAEQKMSDILEAIGGLSVLQRKQLSEALQVFLDPPVSQGVAYQPELKTVKPVLSEPMPHSPPTGLPAGPFESTPFSNQTFHFCNQNTVHSVRVSTFSGSSKDCSYEQFRHDVNCLIRQGCPESMVLTTIKRSIKGQVQKLVLHMGESASVSDILRRFEMMFGDVNPPHVLLAQFYAAEQGANESITEWYARLEDIVCKITRKDASIISPGSYDIVVNTQFWTKLRSGKIKDAFRHKFDALAGSPNFIEEARKVDVEFSAQTVKAQQADAEMSPMFKKGFEEILAQLTAFGIKFSQVTPSTTSSDSTLVQPAQDTEEITTTGVGNRFQENSVLF